MVKWKDKYIIDFCELCDVHIIKCEKCGHGSCSGGGCEYCHDDFEEFFTKKYHIHGYLTELERELYENKIKRIKKFLEICANAGKPEIDWEYIYNEGKHCEMDLEYFPQLKELDDKLKKWK